MQACGTTGLSCVLYNSIYQKSVSRPGSVHSLATGLGTTDVAATRDWLMANIMRSTDEFSRAISANMTELVRSNFEVNDRFNKAWFVSPANRWNVPLSGGAQSGLLLSDKLILFAVITLNDGSGNVLRRRLLSFSPPSGLSRFGGRGMLAIHRDAEYGAAAAAAAAGNRHLLSVPPIQSDAEAFLDALRTLENSPRVGTLPPLGFNIDVPRAAATVYGKESKGYAIMSMKMQGVLDTRRVQSDPTLEEALGAEIYRRLAENKDRFCPQCEGVYPVFTNAQVVASSSTSGSQQLSLGTARRRNLLQASNTTGTPAPAPSTGTTTVAGTVSILLVYDPSLVGSYISFGNLSQVVYSSSYTPVWAGSSDPATLQSFLDTLQANQFVVVQANTTSTTQ